MNNWIIWLEKAGMSLQKQLDEPIPNVWEALEKAKKDELVDGLNYIYRNAGDSNSVQDMANHLVKMVKERS